MKKIVSILTALSLTAVLALAGCGKEEETEEQPKAEQSETDETTDVPEGEEHHIQIDIKDYGTIDAVLYSAAAPETVDNFIKLANAGFYDGLTFHRIISGFMIQGGDPNGNGTGGSDETVKGEFESNGVENPLKHTRGTLSMARSQDKDSASSQFFIMHQDAPHLDGDYAAFGRVTKGMEIVDKICEKVKPVDNNGTVKPENQPVINTIKVID